MQVVAVNNLGKWKTATQMTSLTILLASRDPRLLSDFGVLCLSVICTCLMSELILLFRLKQQSVFVAFGVALLYASAGLAVWSLIVYMRKIWRVLLK